MKNQLLALTTTTLLALPALAQERDQNPHHSDREKPELEAVEKRIKSAVERGDLTREEAKAKFAEVKKEFEQKRRAQLQKQQQEIARRMTKERQETVQRVREHAERRQHAEREHREHKEHHRHEHSERELDEAREHAHHQQERLHRARFEAIERSLHEAVESGLISELDAQKTMAKLHLAAIKHQQKKSRR